MNQIQSAPIIVGTGLSGAAISRALSATGRAHFLIGPPPTNAPTLGESISVEGSIELAGSFPDLGRFCHPKKAAVVYLHDRVVTCNLEFGPILKSLARLLGYAPPSQTVHMDRIGSDRALFDSAVQERSCTYIDARVDDVEYDSGSDKIVGIRLSDQTTLAPSFVFDATNHARRIAKSLGIHVRYLSDLQRVVWTHYRSIPGSTPQSAAAEWSHWTNLLRLHATSDGIDGFAWCIPFGNAVSVGASLNAGDDVSDSHVLAALEHAYARRGVDYRTVYPEETVTCSLRHRYFVHQRAYGRNWLLVGPSFCQIWYMSGSGVGTSLAAARIASQFMDSPMTIGPRYEAYVSELLTSHSVFHWFVHADMDAMTATAIRAKADGLVKSNLRRFVRYAQIGLNRVGCWFGAFLHGLLGLVPAGRGYCRVAGATPGDQFRVICNK